MRHATSYEILECCPLTLRKRRIWQTWDKDKAESECRRLNESLKAMPVSVHCEIQEIPMAFDDEGRILDD